ncbi:hypothetical protein AB0F81_33705 [Actinoplanes sp. NPDC024001]|uniref:hypothetical protein n=1 Tax=Actinoplanes sp. NPDC024001 TaxID=3154598 RepID=UPI0033F2112D
MDGDGDYSYDASDWPSGTDGGGRSTRWDDPTLRRIDSFPISSLRTFSIMVMFFGWTPIVLLTEEHHSWNDEHAFWWRLTLFGWIACTAIVSIIALTEKIAFQRYRRRLTAEPPA